MSAFLCSDYHIATMAKYIVNHEESAIDFQALANKIKHINIAAVDYRYDTKTRATRCNIKEYKKGLTVHDFTVLFTCWDYQACEGNLLNYLILRAYLAKYATGNPTFSELSWSI